MLTETVKEMKYPKRRKNNVISFNAPEPKTNLKAQKASKNIQKSIDVEITNDYILNA